MWWTKIISASACVGMILLSMVMEAYINDARNIWAILWFFAAVAATGCLYLVWQMEPSQSFSGNSSKYWEVYHGTPTRSNILGAINDGFIPGSGGKYGTAVYTAFDFALACTYARGGGYVFKLYINKNTPFASFNQIPGRNIEEKRIYSLRNGYGLVYVERFKLFISYGYTGVPVTIPGLDKVEVFDEYGNQITLQ